MTKETSKKEGPLAQLEAVVLDALEHWELGIDDRGSAELEYVSVSENITFRLTNPQGEAFVVRVHRPGYHSFAELESENLWTAALKDAGIDVPISRRSRGGSIYQSVQDPTTGDQRFVGVIEWVEGDSVSALLAQPVMDFEQDREQEGVVQFFERLGQVAGAIHNQATDWIVPPEFTRHSLDAEGLMGEQPWWGPFWNLPFLSVVERERLLELRRLLYDFLQERQNSPGTFSLIHADLHPGNLIAHSDSLHVIDFDDAGFGFHQYELAVALSYNRDHPQYAAIEAGLIAGYRAQRDLSDETVAELPIFILVRYLASLGWLHHRPELDQSSLPKSVQRAIDLADELEIGC